jgi:arabinan endo-1,5-alpha-L-arabinosidase
VFPVMSSTDLVHWEERGYALSSLDDPDLDAYWAPEVAYDNGKFYLYYAVGKDADPNHHLRVAVAEHPLGPWTDSGRNLTPNDIFAIDAHPFQDPRDGRWYLYYARDSLESPFAGTGIAVDELLGMDRLAGSPKEVLRPFADWQVFELKRAIKNHLDWYTIEGAFVLPVGEGYLCFYSGGRWENPNYGVGYALADHPLGPWKESLGTLGPRVLRTVPGKVIGPGHNSVTLGPDLRTYYLVYHGWNVECTGRYPRIDRLWFEDGRPCTVGPTYTPQPLPEPADFACWFDEAPPDERWKSTGTWLSVEGGTAGCPGSTLTSREAFDDCIVETSVKALNGATEYGVALGDCSVLVGPDRFYSGTASVPLPPGFQHNVWHQIRAERRGDSLTITLDQFPTLRMECASEPVSVSLSAGGGGAFGHFALTRLKG